jgi:hypothetical protein
VTLRRLAILQWAGLLLGGAVWASQLVVGFGVTQAQCGAAGRDISVDAWQAVLMVVAAAFVLAAEAAAVSVVRRTRQVSYDTDPPPLGRIRFFAIAAVAANAAFLLIVILSGIGSLAAMGCTQA